MNEKQLTNTAFFGDKFSVDGYLSHETQHIPLKHLLEELKIYRNDLQNLMGEILRTETESIVYLAENLAQLTTKIQNLFIPISQFKEEIKLLSDGVNSTKKCFEDVFHKVLCNCDKTHFMVYQEYMIKEILMLDKLLNEVQPDDPIYEQLLRKGCNQNAFLRSYINEKALEEVHIKILQQIEETDSFHLSLMTKLFVDGLKSNQMSNMVAILKMFKSLHAHATAEVVYRKHFMKPALNQIFYAKAKASSEDQLIQMFHESTIILHESVVVLHKLMQLNPAIEGFNFIVNSYWIEVDKHLQEILHHYTAPGNPEVFQKRYKAIWRYFDEIISNCRRYEVSYDVKSFDNHIKCFNLSVYYEIRYQQISTRFETVLVKTSKNIEHCGLSTSNAFKLGICSEHWACSALCFQSNIFIDQLVEQFLKLSMLLLSRLLYYFADVCTASDQEKNFVSWQRFYVYALHDLNAMIRKFPMEEADFDLSIFAIVPLAVRPIVLKGIYANRATIVDAYGRLKRNLIELISRASYGYLQSVSSVPRLYRKTNKELPVQPSSYVIEGIKPITTFYKSHIDDLQTDMDSIMDMLVKNVGQQFFDAVTDVLQSVCKIEESLRRLKQRNMTANVEDANVHNDESKIKRQIKLDVTYLVDNLCEFATNQSEGVMQKLRGLV